MIITDTLGIENIPTINFSATTIDGKDFNLSNLRGKKIFLSFLRNGACALCNLRVHEIIQHKESFNNANIEVIAVFESSIEDMKPFVGKQNVQFTLLSDPQGKIYEQFGIKNSPETVKEIIISGNAEEKLQEAEKAGFPKTIQEGSNFFRIPAEVLINEKFEIVKIHHADQLTNHLSIDEVLKTI